MSRKLLYLSWLAAYGVCGTLGLVQPTGDLQSGAMTLCSILFFVPPGILLATAIKHKDLKTMRRIRLICILCLSLTLVCLIANIAVFNASEAVGNLLMVVLNFLSVPMVCSQYYALSLFLWACMLFTTCWRMLWASAGGALLRNMSPLWMQPCCGINMMTTARLL